MRNPCQYQAHQLAAKFIIRHVSADDFRKPAKHFNPLAGIFTLYRMAFFPDMWDARTVLTSVAMSLILLVLGVWVFRKLERPVLKGL